ncbi:uncharacterized protein [Musca autumnalis]|uniref:uncharacterized protein n=1 Tax=Musca autumnalis TaxID=221902 RepID=UPI003CEB7D4A
MDKLLEKFWKLEEPPKISEYSPEEEYCEDVYQKTTRRLSDGRYVVSLPFKPQYENGKGLGLSRMRACRQFFRNESSLCKKPEFKVIYDNVLEEYESLGHMTEVTQDDEGSSSFYLPHHAVIKPESSSTKVRVVFNASSRSTTGLSLNDTLYPGPILQNDLMLLIIRWRFYRYVFNGDVEKMYRQIWLNEDHTRFQRLVFRTDPKASLKNFELKTVTFGVNCAPFLAIRTLLQLASDVEKDLPLAAKILRRMMYVDDALAGAHELEVAIEARDQLVCALTSAGFSMRKWTSNEEQILQGLPPDHLLSEKLLEIEDESNAKTLGIRWNAKSDFFYFSVKPIQMKSNFTKREVLSIIASLFDPAGGPILSPPEPEIHEAPESILNRWQRVKALNQRLCLRWKEEYLKELTKRNKWKNPDDNVKVNDMVVVKEDNIPPNEWRLGRIVKVLPGVDQLVRVAEVKTERGLITRPVVKLVVLPSN